MRTVLLALLAALIPAEALVVGTPSIGGRSAVARSPLRNVRLEEPPPPPPQKLGATIDQDGKSNVWVRHTYRRVPPHCHQCGMLCHFLAAHIPSLLSSEDCSCFVILTCIA